MLSRNIFKGCLSALEKKKSTSCRLLLLFISCSLKVTQRQRSLSTQTSEGHKKKIRRDDYYSFEMSTDLACLQDHQFQAQYLYTKHRKKPAQVSFHSRGFSLSSSITNLFCALIDSLKSMAGTELTMLGYTSLSFGKKSHIRKIYTIKFFFKKQQHFETV